MRLCTLNFPLIDFTHRNFTHRNFTGDGANMGETANPWTVLSRATVYENEWIRVDHHEVLNLAGGPGIYGKVHFKKYATGVVPIDEEGNVILVGQYRFTLDA